MKSTELRLLFDALTSEYLSIARAFDFHANNASQVLAETSDSRSLATLMRIISEAESESSEYKQMAKRFSDANFAAVTDLEGAIISSREALADARELASELAQKMEVEQESIRICQRMKTGRSWEE